MQRNFIEYNRILYENILIMIDFWKFKANILAKFTYFYLVIFSDIKNF